MIEQHGILAPLTPQQLVAVWEENLNQDPVRRAVSILANGLTSMTLATVAQLSLGQRNSNLFRMREQLFGKQMDCLFNCLFCHEIMEFTLMTDVICPTVSLKGDDTSLCSTIQNYSVRFRLLTSQDLIACSEGTTVEEISGLLLQRSILEIKYRGKIIEIVALPEQILHEFSQCLKKADPHAELLLDWLCPHCGKQGKTIFDIANFLWQEISTYVPRILYEVHQLATVYGWQESEILSMSTKRRQLYLNWIT